MPPMFGPARACLCLGPHHHFHGGAAVLAFSSLLRSSLVRVVGFFVVGFGFLRVSAMVHYGGEEEGTPDQIPVCVCRVSSVECFVD